MTTWREQLLPASFRGVPFHVERATVPVGRSVQLHEYPKKDDPLAEDMGRVSRVHKLTAFVVGDDAFSRRDKLLEALEKGGPGDLVHPFLGRVQVVAGECEMSHDRREGGLVRFDLVFYPGQVQQFPAARANTGQLLGKASASYWDQARGWYSQAMAALDLGAVNVRALRGQLGGVFGLLSRHLGPVASLYGDAGALADALVSAPGGLSSALASYLGRSPSAASGVRERAKAGGFDTYADSLAAAGSLSVSAQEVNQAPGGGGQATTAAAQAVVDLVQSAVIVQALRAVAGMPVPRPPVPMAVPPSLQAQLVEPVARPPVAVADDVLATRDDLSAAMWQAASKSPPAGFVEANKARQAMARHLSAVAAQGVQLVTVEPLETVPALVLAHRLYGDATRADEVAQRNRVAHLGFIAPRPLRVLKG